MLAAHPICSSAQRKRNGQLYVMAIEIQLLGGLPSLWAAASPRQIPGPDLDPSFFALPSAPFETQSDPVGLGWADGSKQRTQGVYEDGLLQWPRSTICQSTAHKKLFRSIACPKCEHVILVICPMYQLPTQLIRCTQNSPIIPSLGTCGYGSEL